MVTLAWRPLASKEDIGTHSKRLIPSRIVVSLKKERAKIRYSLGQRGIQSDYISLILAKNFDNPFKGGSDWIHTQGWL